MSKLNFDVWMNEYNTVTYGGKQISSGIYCKAWSVSSSNPPWDHVGGGCGTCIWILSTNTASPHSFWITVYNLHWLWIPIDRAEIFLMLSSIHPSVNPPIHPPTSVLLNKVRPQKSCCFLSPHWPVSRARASKRGHAQGCHAISSQIWLIQSLGFTWPPQSHRLIGPIVQ